MALRGTFEEHESRIKEARRGLESVRAEAAQLDVARATAEADLTHQSAACVETVQASLDEVSAEVNPRSWMGRASLPRRRRRPNRPGRRPRQRSPPTKWSSTCGPRSIAWAPST